MRMRGWLENNDKLPLKMIKAPIDTNETKNVANMDKRILRGGDIF